jgi:L-ribulose-5-phosphate 3-epimerase
MATIGIMQSRLGPPVEGRFQFFPRETWEAEFERARHAELESIEWLYDLYGADVNPLATNQGIDTMHALSARYNVAIKSLCADYFMKRTLLHSTPVERDELLRTLSWLIDRCSKVGIKHIVMPFVDSAKIETECEVDKVVSIMQIALEDAERANVGLHLETSLRPDRLAALLDRLTHPMLKAHYDSGNSASLGYVPREEFALYGPRIGSIHIKDRIRGGGTVPLGTGDADFPALFQEISRVGYPGDYILEAARGEPGDEVNWSAKNRNWVVAWLRSTGLIATVKDGVD